MRVLFFMLAIVVTILSCKSDKKETAKTTSETPIDSVTVEQAPEIAKIEVHPISHASMVLTFEETVIYVDPVGGAELFASMPKPTLILVTDIHGDHMNFETLEAIAYDGLPIVAPKAVAEKAPASLKSNLNVLSNGEQSSLKNVQIEGIPMYNLREEALKFHEKGRGNGYVVTLGGKRIYISGDTEDIPEMRQLKNIDIAFVCMNLPYTMTVESAASAVLDFKPKKVYPYHYRGTEGLSDVEIFKTLVNQGDKDIEVVQLDWYKQ